MDNNTTVLSVISGSEVTRVDNDVIAGMRRGGMRNERFLGMLSSPATASRAVDIWVLHSNRVTG